MCTVVEALYIYTVFPAPHLIRNTGYLHRSRGTTPHNRLYLSSPTYTYTYAFPPSQKFPRPPDIYSIPMTTAAAKHHT